CAISTSGRQLVSATIRGASGHLPIEFLSPARRRPDMQGGLACNRKDAETRSHRPRRRLFRTPDNFGRWVRGRKSLRQFCETFFGKTPSIPRSLVTFC